ncbi:hypothetical protein AB0E75_23150 [Streptomyces griseoviridis]|uniref:Uncharacterized protein n=1 Tax=Streptomyces griseoviridis TaxID=45398 RepID=A0A918GLM0_STRGD|nr:hypothetical protein [Streptomyces niveoruber]GGS45181.1 hypothetical protein GCM10010238_38790 [Streptomyces niveoruber]
MIFTRRDGNHLAGVLVYDDSEYGFSFNARSAAALGERLGSKGVASILIDTLQLEVDIESGEILFAWGYFPNVRSEVSELRVPAITSGRVVISSEDIFDPGVSYEVPGSRWRTLYDPSSGWVAICTREAVDADFVEVAEGVVLGIERGGLASVWLKPVFR